jgi:hypothetical protein
VDERISEEGKKLVSALEGMTSDGKVDLCKKEFV